MSSACLLPVVMATAIVLVRKLTQNDVPVPLCFAALSFMSFINGCFLRVTYEEAKGGGHFKNCLLSDNLLLVPITLVHLTNQLFIYYAAKFEKSVIVLVISTSKVVLLFFIDMILFPDELYSYNFLHYSGGTIVLFSILALVLRKPCLSCFKSPAGDNNSL